MKKTIFLFASLFLFVLSGNNAIGQSNTAAKSVSETLIDFGGRVQNNAISLSWRTLTPLENVHFNIQRSKSALDWEDIGTVNGESNKPGSFSFVDNNLTEAVLFYRLKIESGNNVEYSSMISVKYIPETNKTLLYPNPTKNVIWIKSEQTMNSNDLLDLEVYNVLGEKVYASKMEGDMQSVDMSEYSKGFYCVKIGNQSYKVFKE